MFYRLVSTTRLPGTEGQIRGAVDGCQCCFVVKTSLPIGVSLERFGLEGRECVDDLLISDQWLPVCMRIGQAPDLVGGEQDEMSFRGLLEKLLLGLTVGSSIEADIEHRVESEHRSGKVFLRLHQLSLPPVFRPTPVSVEQEKGTKEDKKKKKGATDLKAEQEDKESDPVWPAGLSRLWLLRATSLKERGNWLLTDPSAHPSPAYASNRLEAAFACYSRALQLVVLLDVSGHLPTKEGLEGLPEAESVVGNLEEEYVEYFDLDQPKVTLQPGENNFRVDVVSLAKLHFNLLSNMALCQLKAGSNSFVVKQCTAALELAPVDDENLSENTDHISRLDVEKVVFRRASAYAAMGLLDEAEEDLHRVLRLSPDGNPKARQLLARVRKEVTEMQAKMSARLKNAF